MTDIVERLREEAQDDIESLFYKAADEIERLRSGAAWRPIETAPKDGTRVLLFVPPYGAMTGHNTWHNWNDDKCSYWHCHACLNKEGHPTHWMPLPYAPEKAND